MHVHICTHKYSTVHLLLHFYMHMVPRKIFKNPHYVFAWYMSCVAPCMAFPYVVISWVAIPQMVISRMPFYTCCSMKISYMSGAFSE